MKFVIRLAAQKCYNFPHWHDAIGDHSVSVDRTGEGRDRCQLSFHLNKSGEYNNEFQYHLSEIVLDVVLYSTISYKPR